MANSWHTRMKDSSERGKNMKAKQVFSVVSLVFLCGITHAQTGSAVSGSSVSTEGAGPSLLDQLYLSYSATYKGQPLNDIGSSRTVNREGLKDLKSGINFDSEVNAGYKFSNEIGAGVVVPFLLFPVQGRGFVLGDIGVKAYDKKAIATKDVTVSANLILQAPTSTFSQDNEMFLGVKTTPSVVYRVPGSHFRLGSLSEAKAYLGATKDKTFKLYAKPFAEYALSDSFAFNVGYEMEWHHKPERPFLQFATYKTALMPGFTWNITPKIYINPYVQIFTTADVGSDTMALGAYLSAAVL